METMNLFNTPPESSRPQPSSSRPANGKYQFVDLTDSPTPSPERQSESQESQSSQTSQSSRASKSSQSDSLWSYTQSQPSQSSSRPNRSNFTAYPSYQPRAPAVMSQPLVDRNRALAQGDINKPVDLTRGISPDFGSSIVKSNSSAARPKPSQHNPMNASGSHGAGWIRPGTGAFNNYHHQPTQMNYNNVSGYSHPQQQMNGDKAWPSWLMPQKHNLPNRPNHPSAHTQQPHLLPHGSTSRIVSDPRQAIRDVDEDGNPREIFDINAIETTAGDWERYQGDADQHMQELLSGAIGDGEEDMGDDKVKEGEDTVEGFAEGIKLMPHQVRGVRWMRQRESGRKYGGILADDMGLGKTVQTLARIVEGVATTAEKKAGYKGGTLIVAPLAVMEQWATEVTTKTTKGRLKVTTHHGPSRTKSGEKLALYDVVITTFQTLASEYGAREIKNATPPVSDGDSDSDSDTSAVKKIKKKTRAPSKKAGHALFDLKWLRVVIDEAQNIKNKSTKAAKATYGLKAKYRWCLTGTPIQNNIDELFSLFHFLQAKPLDNWDVFRARISNLVKDGRTKLAMKRLHVVLKAVMLRRTKDATIDGKPILNLPGRKVEVVRCQFDEEERAFYMALEKQTKLTFNKFVANGTVMANYTDVLVLLLRLRQACDHPSLVTASWATDQDAIENKTTAKADDSDDGADELAIMLGGLGVDAQKKCDVCFSILVDTSAKQCLECQAIAQKAKANSLDLPPVSTKIKHLIKLLQDVEERSEGREKTIVFSQFTSFLNLCEPFLKKEGIKYVRYDGSMRNDKRQEALNTIKTAPHVRVILISFKAGSTGLNLTCCNNVVLTDLWWNPALEDQAFDRAHRLGQKLDVNIWKLTIEETVEDRILALQATKRELAAAALSGEATKNIMKLTMNDLMALFRATE